ALNNSNYHLHAILTCLHRSTLGHLACRIVLNTLTAMCHTFNGILYSEGHSPSFLIAAVTAQIFPRDRLVLGNATVGQRFIGERLEDGERSSLHIADSQLGDSGSYLCAVEHSDTGRAGLRAKTLILRKAAWRRSCRGRSPAGAKQCKSMVMLKTLVSTLLLILVSSESDSHVAFLGIIPLLIY
uniref:Immunoglobulin V-set domain-containing protein n=1 Tax=Gopherus evgoodei TaxID=1825980 RepID=A0A8C4Y716_9SAUR